MLPSMARLSASSTADRFWYPAVNLTTRPSVLAAFLPSRAQCDATISCWFFSASTRCSGVRAARARWARADARYTTSPAALLAATVHASTLLARSPATARTASSSAATSTRACAMAESSMTGSTATLAAGAAPGTGCAAESAWSIASISCSTICSARATSGAVPLRGASPRPYAGFTCRGRGSSRCTADERRARSAAASRSSARFCAVSRSCASSSIVASSGSCSASAGIAAERSISNSFFGAGRALSELRSWFLSIASLARCIWAPSSMPEVSLRFSTSRNCGVAPPVMLIAGVIPPCGVCPTRPGVAPGVCAITLGVAMFCCDGVSPEKSLPWMSDMRDSPPSSGLLIALI
mmetsp:Transcript_8233/g.20087  ORF Transcript_8233/g.20087 Transcript_8233/m.20087 type:complete len:353 (+) Transcript_8233:298-1356(+)